MKRLAIAFFPLLLVSAAQAQDLPAGKGKDLLEKICTVCHDLDRVASNFTTKQSWEDTINEMVSLGADGTKDELQTILNYVAKYFGPMVEVNKAAAKELETELEITPKEAAAIVQYRKDKGNFKDWADLGKVSGLDIKKLEPLKGRISF
jgi:competence ComEA-like helix-hairpin-helix protein